MSAFDKIESYFLSIPDLTADGHVDAGSSVARVEEGSAVLAADGVGRLATTSRRACNVECASTLVNKVYFGCTEIKWTFCR